MEYEKENQIYSPQLAISKYSYGERDPYHYRYSAIVGGKKVVGYGKTPSKAMDNALKMQTTKESESD